MAYEQEVRDNRQRSAFEEELKLARLLSKGELPNDPYGQRVLDRGLSRGFTEDEIQRYLDSLVCTCAPIAKKIVGPQASKRRLPELTPEVVAYVKNALPEHERLAWDTLILWVSKDPSKNSGAQSWLLKKLQKFGINKLGNKEYYPWDGRIVGQESLPDNYKVKSIDYMGKTPNGVRIFGYHKWTDNNGGSQRSDGEIEPMQAVEEAIKVVENEGCYFAFSFDGTYYSNGKLISKLRKIIADHDRIFVGTGDEVISWVKSLTS